MIVRREGVLALGAASAAEVGAHLALDSALVSLAAFGSVLGVGVLHFRTRRAKLRAQPSLTASPPLAPSPSPSSFTELSAMPQPQPSPFQPRRDETFIAVAELCTRIDELQRTLDADDGIPQRLDAIRQQLAGVASALELRADRASDEGAQHAAALAEACRAIEARVGASEARISENTRRIERAMQDGEERSADRAEASLVRLTRELATLRDDVQRASSGITELASSQTAPVVLADEHAHLLADAAESAADLGRRVASLANELDASFSRLETANASGVERLDEGMRAARAQLESLARDAASLHESSRSFHAMFAQNEERIARALRESETRLATTMRELREVVRALPAPETPDLSPVVSALIAAEERVAARLHSMEASLRPQAVDFEPIANAIRDTQSAIVDRIDRIAGEIHIPRPAPLDLGPAMGAVRTAEERLQKRLVAIEHTIASQNVDLAPVTQAVRDARAELAAMVARAQKAAEEARTPPTDLAPLAVALSRVEERLRDRLDVMQETLAPHEMDLRPIVDAVRDAIRAIPAPSRVDLAPVEGRLDALTAAVERIHIPAPERVDLAPVERGVKAVHEAVARIHIPAPAPVDLAPIERGLQEVGAAVARINIPTPEPVDIAPLAQKLDAVADAIARIPEPERVDLAPLEEKLEAMGQRIEPIARPLRATEERLTLRLDRLAEAVLNLPEPERVDIAPVQTALQRASERIDAVRSLVEAIPAPKPADLRPIHARIDALREAIEAMPAPEIPPFPEFPAFPIDEIQGAMRATEQRLAESLRKVRDDIASGMPELDVAPFLASLREAEERIARRMASLSETERGARREEALQLGSSIAALRQAIEVIPQPPAFPLDAIVATLRDLDERAGRRLSSATEAERVARREETLRLEAAMANLRQALDVIPAPPPFPIEEMTGAVREAEERIARRAANATEAERVARREETLRLEAALAALREAILAIPAPPEIQPFPIETIRTGFRDVESRIDQAIASLPRPESPKPFPLDELRAAMIDGEARVRMSVEGVRDAIRNIPRPEPVPAFPLDEIRASVQAAQERVISALQPLDSLRSTSEEAHAASVARFAELQRAVASLHHALRDAAAHHDAALGPLADSLAAVRAAVERHAAGAAERLDTASKWLHEESQRAESRFEGLHEATRPILPALEGIEKRLRAASLDATRPIADELERANELIHALPERMAPSFAPLATNESLIRARDALVDAIREERAATADRVASLQDATTELLRHERAALGEQILGIPSSITASVEQSADRTAASISKAVDELARRLDAATAHVTEETLIVVDAVEDLRADADARHRHLEALLATQESATRIVASSVMESNEALRSRIEKLESASQQREAAAKARLATFQPAVLDALETTARRMDERVSALEARLGDALAFTDREEELERRIGARIAALEARVLEALARGAARESVVPAPYARSQRRAPRNVTE